MAAAGEIKLKSLEERMRCMLENAKGTDVCFEVGLPGEETVIIRAHKCILISCSDYFDTMFSIGMSECMNEPDKPNRVEDIDVAIFKDVLL